MALLKAKNTFLTFIRCLYLSATCRALKTLSNYSLTGSMAVLLLAAISYKIITLQQSLVHGGKVAGKKGILAAKYVYCISYSNSHQFQNRHIVSLSESFLVLWLFIPTLIYLAAWIKALLMLWLPYKVYIVWSSFFPPLT